MALGERSRWVHHDIVRMAPYLRLIWSSGQTPGSPADKFEHGLGFGR
jgi:hypothetical protein